MQYEMSREKLRHYFGNVTYIDDKFDFCLVDENKHETAHAIWREPLAYLFSHQLKFTRFYQRNKAVTLSCFILKCLVNTTADITKLQKLLKMYDIYPLFLGCC